YGIGRVEDVLYPLSPGRVLEGKGVDIVPVGRYNEGYTVFFFQLRAGIPRGPCRVCMNQVEMKPVPPDRVAGRTVMEIAQPPVLRVEGEVDDGCGDDGDVRWGVGVPDEVRLPTVYERADRNERRYLGNGIVPDQYGDL